VRIRAEDWGVWMGLGAVIKASETTKDKKQRHQKDTSQPIKWVKQQLGSRVPSVPSARLSASLEHSFMLCTKCTATIKSGQADLQAELQGYTGYT
jgi:hypothetical protein